MPLRVQCPACRQSYIVPDTQLGKQVRCAQCQQAFQIAGPAPSVAARARSGAQPPPAQAPKPPPAPTAGGGQSASRKPAQAPKPPPTRTGGGQPAPRKPAPAPKVPPPARTGGGGQPASRHPAQTPNPPPKSRRLRGCLIVTGLLGVLFVLCAGVGGGVVGVYLLMPHGTSPVALEQPGTPLPLPGPPALEPPPAAEPARPVPTEPAKPAVTESAKSAAPEPVQETAPRQANPSNGTRSVGTAKAESAKPASPATAERPAQAPDSPPEKLAAKAFVGRQLQYNLLPARAPDAHFELSGPRGMSLAMDGQLYWRPGPDAVGTHEFTVRVVGRTQVKTLRYQIEVEEDSTLKSGATLPVKAVIGKPFRYQLPNGGGAIKYEIPAGVKQHYSGLDMTSDGVMTWTPPVGTPTGPVEILVLLDNEGRRYRLEVEESPESGIALPLPGSWVMLPDGVTLIVSLPDKAQLVTIDTVAVKETRRVELNFKPGALAFQGKQLFAAAEGSGQLHVLDLATGAEQKEIRVSDAALSALACHPEKGLLYASNGKRQVLAVDPASGQVYDTGAQGIFLAIDPVNGDALYTGIQGQMRDVVIVQRAGANQYTMRAGTVGKHAALLKYAVNGTSLQAVSANENAADNGHVLRVSADGKKVGIVGGGGYRPPADAAAGANFAAYGVALFSTDDAKTMLGVVQCGGYPFNLAFHPNLDIGVVEQTGIRSSTLHFFNSKSLVETETIPFSPGPNETSPPSGRPTSSLLAFGARGTKLLYHDVDSSHLHLIPLKLSDADREALAKAYGK